MTTQPRIALDDLTSDALDTLYDRLDLLEAGARERSALLEEARDALEAAGAGRVHGDDWPRLVPAIEELARRADTADAVAEGNLRHVKQLIPAVRAAEARVRELEAEVARYEEVVIGNLNEANIRLQRQLAEDAEEHRQAHEIETENTAREIDRALAAEATVARVRQTVDTGPVGSCCAHLIRGALNPPVGLTAEEREAADGYAAKLNTHPARKPWRLSRNA
ncbi:hypothetical protein [Streptomyces sp. sk226]|uniref:hypothetical protein n=1 Tax=Streptomyces sp. sk226 TaxID=2034268 RepID=UPI000BF05941|nr:hypothetical protein [Streptomyces sp. sk226]